MGEAVGRRVAATAFAAILPVRDLVAAAAHYRALGFAVEAFQGDAPYAFASWGPVDLHLAGSAGLDPATNSSMAYLYVDDADALYARWRAAGVAGRLVVPLDTDYGLREGAHVDPDGNLLRFGSPLAS
ncbi:MAG: VOC family protein [Acidimicrobiia bacterium]|nr:VOC family protein [Acidimicrobiia bacterium]